MKEIKFLFLRVCLQFLENKTVLFIVKENFKLGQQ